MGEYSLIPSLGVEGIPDDLVWSYEHQVGTVYNFVLRRCGGDIALAEDITQETFLGAARYFRSSGDVPGLGWLHEVARRRLVDHWRAESLKERKLRLFRLRRAESAADHADEVVSGHRVAAALGALPAAQRAVFVLHHLDGYPTSEVAETIGRSLKATESLLARARSNLAATYWERAHE